MPSGRVVSLVAAGSKLATTKTSLPHCIVRMAFPPEMEAAVGFPWKTSGMILVRSWQACAILVYCSIRLGSWKYPRFSGLGFFAHRSSSAVPLGLSMLLLIEKSNPISSYCHIMCDPLSRTLKMTFSAIRLSRVSSLVLMAPFP